MAKKSKISVLLLLGGGFLIAAPIIRAAIYEIDHQFAHIGTAISGSLAALFFGIYTYRRISNRMRLTLAALCLLGLGAFIASYEFKGFNGETIPIFRLRTWISPKVDTSKSSDLKSSEESSLTPIALKSTFSQLLGNLRSGVVSSDELNIQWESTPPKLLWKQPIGEGWSGVSIGNGLAFTMYQSGEEEVIVALELLTGTTKWDLKLPGKHSEPLGGTGPRATPTLFRDQLITQTATGWLVCLDAKTGAVSWKKNLIEGRFKNQADSESAIKWGRSGSPLVVPGKDRDQVIVPLGGSQADVPRSLRSLDLKTGETLWDSGPAQISYASPALITLDGVEQIVSVNEGNATGHSLDGKLLWETPWSSHSDTDACASQPVALDSNRILLGKGYALGSKMVRVTQSTPGQWKAEDIWNNPRMLKTKFTNAISYDSRLYALSDGVLECVDPNNGKRIWRGGRFGQGQLLVVNDRLLIAAEDGRMVLAERAEGKILYETPVLDGITWNIPSVAGPFLILRNGTEIACFLSSKTPSEDDSTKPSTE